ncbi:hypothetical protein ACFX2J_020638 [Malus domestica]
MQEPEETFGETIEEGGGRSFQVIGTSLLIIWPANVVNKLGSLAATWTENKVRETDKQTINYGYLIATHKSRGTTPATIRRNVCFFIVTAKLNSGRRYTSLLFESKVLNPLFNALRSTGCCGSSIRVMLAALLIKHK